MSVLDAIILGVVQGLTEFLPVSSSGHLVLGQHFLGITNPEVLTFDVYVHFGTLLSLLVIFWRDVISMLRSFGSALLHKRIVASYRESDFFRLAVSVLVASIPAAVIGIAFHARIEEAFTDPKLVAVNLVITGLILFLTRLAKPAAGKKMGIVTAFVVGLGQAFAILPGISRSGTTISTGMYMRLSPSFAARFSFLMAIPVIAGAALLEGTKLFKSAVGIAVLPTVAGTIASAITGYFAIRLLMKVIERGKFGWFSFYCLALGIAGILI